MKSPEQVAINCRDYIGRKDFLQQVAAMIANRDAEMRDEMARSICLCSSDPTEPFDDRCPVHSAILPAPQTGLTSDSGLQKCVDPDCLQEHGPHVLHIMPVAR